MFLANCDVSMPDGVETNATTFSTSEVATASTPPSEEAIASMMRAKFPHVSPDTFANMLEYCDKTNHAASQYKSDVDDSDRRDAFSHDYPSPHVPWSFVIH